MAESLPGKGFDPLDGASTTVGLLEPEAPIAGVEEAVHQQEQIQSVLGALLHISLEDMPFEKQLDRTIIHLASLGWLALDAKGAIFLTDPSDEHTLVMKAHHNLSPSLLTMCARVPFGRCLCGRAAVSGQLLFVNCVDHRHENQPEGMKAHGHYCVPIILQGRVLGVITLYVKEGHPQNTKEAEFLAAVTDAMAGIIQHRHTEEELKTALERLRQNLKSIIQTLAFVVETRDPYTAGHQQHVAELAAAMARQMGLPQAQIDVIHMAGLVHDIGKIAVPSDILNKPGKISAIERDLIKNHSAAGYDILEKIDFAGPIARIVLQHHERMDGSGYPGGLVGNDILLEARIIAVADVVDAIMSHRPYRPALGKDVALEEIVKHKGTFYDARAADACVQLMTEGGFTFA